MYMGCSDRSGFERVDHDLFFLKCVVAKTKLILSFLPKGLRKFFSGDIVDLLQYFVAARSWTLVLTKYLERKGQVNRPNPLLVLNNTNLERTYENINSCQNKIHSKLAYEAVFSSKISIISSKLNLINRKRSFV